MVLMVNSVQVDVSSHPASCLAAASLICNFVDWTRVSAFSVVNMYIRVLGASGLLTTNVHLYHDADHVAELDILQSWCENLWHSEQSPLVVDQRSQHISKTLVLHRLIW